MEIAYKATEDKAEIAVTDSGHGISKGSLSKIMQPFFTTKGIGQATGLGLGISKGIIESHRGLLEYDEASTRTRFVISLPISQTSPAYH